MEDIAVIKTLQNITNVGRFVSFTGGDDVPFRKLTLIYAENGRGKTTLVDIFRSLRSGKAHYITARRTLGSHDSQEVSILLESGAARFREGGWDKTLADIEVFDQTFIHENVYVGDSVETNHKQNLYRVILGEKGVELSGEVDRLGKETSDLAVNEARNRVEANRPKWLSLKDFIGRPAPDGDLDARLAKLRAELSAMRRDPEIRRKGYLKKIYMPALPERLFEVLATELRDISENAEEAIQSHLQRCGMDSQGHSWLEQGLGYASSGLCPFCEGQLTGNRLIESFRAFFADSYRRLKAEIEELRAEVENQFGEEKLLQLLGHVTENGPLSAFWRQFVSLDLPDLPTDDLQTFWIQLRQAALDQLERKRKSPLDPIGPIPVLEDAKERWTRLSSGPVKAFNEAVHRINMRSIAGLKQSIDDPNRLEVDLDQEVRELEAIKLRHSPEIDKDCRDYATALQEKGKLETRKKEAKEHLDAYTQDIMPKYERSVAALLEGYGAGFRVRFDQKAQLTRGRRPSTDTARPSTHTSYEISINKTDIIVGPADPEPETACFKTTLSSGDRSALALAFFLARLHQAPRLPAKIVVFDDPITSQDDSRSAHTAQLVRDLYDRTNQVVVLSHDPRFLQAVQGKVPASNVLALKIIASAEDRSALAKWDI